MAVKTVQATINGQVYTLTLNSHTGNYEATITAPSKSSYPLEGHYYGVSVKATDDAGNITTKDQNDGALGQSLRLKVKEKVAPIILITYPTASAVIINNKPKITFKVTDDDSGVNPDTIGVTIDSGTKITGEKITKEKIEGGYECSYVPETVLADGSHTIKIDADDFDGNHAVQKAVTFKVDTVPPALTVSNPTDGSITNQSTVNVVGKTNDVTSSPVKVTIKLNAGNAESVEVNSSGDFTKTLTLTQGVNTITVVATDSAGKQSTITRTVTYDTSAPVISKITITPNPVDAGKTYVISVTVTD